MVKAFSSEVADLEPILALLLRCDAQVSSQVSLLLGLHNLLGLLILWPGFFERVWVVRHAKQCNSEALQRVRLSLADPLMGGRMQTREDPATEGLWQAQCTLLLWLSQLLLIPFDLATVDSSAGVATSAALG